MITFFKEYFHQVKREATVIKWPDKDQVYSSTVLVLVVTLVVAFIIGVLDFAFNGLFFSLIG